MKGIFTQRQSLIAYAVSLLAMTVGSVVLSACFPSGGEASVYLSFALPQIFYLSATFFLSKFWKKDVKIILGFKNKLTPLDIILTVTLAIGLFFFALLPVFGLTELLSRLNLPSTVTVPSTDTAGGIVLCILILCILPAIGEEIMFRGVIASSFSGVGGYSAALLCGAIFSLSHLSTAQTLHQFFVGVILAILFLRKRNILLPILAHFVNNVLAIFAEAMIPALKGVGLDSAGLTLLAPLCAGGLVVFLLSYYFLYFKGKKIKQGIAEFSAEYPKKEKIEITTYLWIGVLIVMLICVSVL